MTPHIVNSSAIREQNFILQETEQFKFISQSTGIAEMETQWHETPFEAWRKRISRSDLKENDKEQDNSQTGSTLLERQRRSKIETICEPKKAQNQHANHSNNSTQVSKTKQIWRLRKPHPLQKVDRESKID